MCTHFLDVDTGAHMSRYVERHNTPICARVEGLETKNVFQLLLVPVYDWKTVEIYETDDELLCKSENDGVEWNIPLMYHLF